MLEKVCNHVHNFFIRNAYPGSYEITGGQLALTGLKDGQRFQIVGSDLNDGVYTWHADGTIQTDDDDAPAALADEAFDGTVLALAPPKAFLELVARIAAWQDQYGDKALSPFQSESVVGVYSYTKADGGSGAAGGSAAGTWEAAFASDLNPYRTPGVPL